MTKKIALIGARGYVGQELLHILASQPSGSFELVYATSREHAGRKVCEVFPKTRFQCKFEQPEPERLAEQPVDIVVLGLPNGFAAPYVAALEKCGHPASIIDLSSDHRHNAGWVYGLSDVFAEDIRASRRIANPGCYATAATLALYPLREIITGTPSIFGVSGYSGAGTKPSEKNDPDRLADSILPYAFDGHGHQSEISATLGCKVRFLPHVAQFFRGLMVSITVPLAEKLDVQDVRHCLEDFYAAQPTVQIQGDYPYIGQVSNTPNAIIGGFAIVEETRQLAYVSVLDNLQKGAAAQCYDNMVLIA